MRLFTFISSRVRQASRVLVLLCMTPLFTLGAAHAQTSSPSPSPSPADWATVEQTARGQTVYFNAWAGSQPINAYIDWVAETVTREHGITLQHVKISDAADVVKRIRTEKQAGRGEQGGTVDLLWINGENFAAMKREGLLAPPFATALPHFQWVDTVKKPSTLRDFSEPTDGLESPWGMAQLTFFADRARVATPPQSMAEWLTFAQANPGRSTYPRVPDFHGTTFIKQALIEFAADARVLSQPVNADTFKAQTQALWVFLDALHPHLWRGG
ncbi:MAG: ABC transporter substrate-binding protein, partial [Burkholderiaceae bacterium]|nr:ABC transporter substrate-binding protein [Burkholderiaceae bacterium]